MRARDIMTSPPVTATMETPLGEVAKTMHARRIGAVPIVDGDGKLRGIITEGDFTDVGRSVPFTLELAPVIFGGRAATLEELKKIYDAARELRACDVMTEKVVSATEDEEVGPLVRRMLDKDVRHVPVVRDGRPVGMVARHDVLKLLLG